MTQDDAARRDRRLSTADGGFYSLMVGFGETYLAAFALAIGMGQVGAGLLATVPLLAGGALQLLAPRGVRVVGSYRRWVVLCAASQAMVYAPLAYFAFRGEIDPVLLYAIAAVYWAAALAAGPAWNNWIDKTIPKLGFSDFIATRTRVTQLAAFVAFLGAGYALHVAEEKVGRSNLILSSFGWLFVAAGLSRIISTICLALQSDARHTVKASEEPALKRIAASFFESGSGRFLLFVLVSQTAVHIAAPFFSPYMLAQLKLSYGEYVVLISTGFLTKIIFFPTIAKFVARLGAYRTLWVAGLFVAPLPLAWVLTPELWVLCLSQVVAGFMWGSFELAAMLLVFDRISAAERLSILTVFNLLNAAAVVLGSLIGGAMLEHWPKEQSYLYVFVLSAAARFLSLLALTGTRPVAIRFRNLYVRTIALRPGARTPADQPILTSHDDGD